MVKDQWIVYWKPPKDRLVDFISCWLNTGLSMYFLLENFDIGFDPEYTNWN